MCGLVVTASFDGQPADPLMLKRMSDTLWHRGPDDAGLATYDSVGFGFRRLSILDLSPGGHQPMETSDGRLSVVFNGEIYNYVELRDELEQQGHRFRSSSDTEVLLTAYSEWGDQCVHRLNGMWAFVIYDRVTQRLFASRDRFGVKPLYRWSDGRRLIFASEAKAILASSWYRPVTNWQSVAEFVCRGRLDEDQQTFYVGVEQVPAGSTLEIDMAGRTTERRFWSLQNLNEEPPADPVKSFRDLFEDSVRLRMRSDVPVGICLSGGIDSNAILSTMAAERTSDVDYPLQAFSYIPSEFSEAEYIHEAVSRTGTKLNELETTPRDLWDSLPTVLWHHDAPVHSPTALIGFQLLRLAKSRGVTVVLNGQGADEVNAGYHAYFRVYWTELLAAGQWQQFRSEVAAYCQTQKVPYRPLIRKAIAHWARNEVSRLPGYGSMRRFGGALRRDEHDGWFAPELLRQLRIDEPSSRNRILTAALEFSIERRPLPLYLRVEDRNSMAHSVEVRLPFLDYRLVSLARALPNQWKLRGPWNKYVVREAMKGIMAEPVRLRADKMGFPTPSRQWLAGPWYEPARDVLASQSFRESGLCDLHTVERAFQEHKSGTSDFSERLFNLAQLAIWLSGTHSGERPASSAIGKPSYAPA